MRTPPHRATRAFHLACALAALYPRAAGAQQATQNAVTAAADAFGVTIGNESIGLYSPQQVRGFSAIQAGNARLDGLYFDQVANPSERLVDEATIRVGISAQGFPFPAPTGVVDYALREPGNTTALGVFALVGNYANDQLSADASLPLIGTTLIAGLGLARNDEGYFDGSHDVAYNTTASLLYRPNADLTFFPFFSRSGADDIVNQTLYESAGDFRPPSIRRRVYQGPDWATSGLDHYNFGGIATWHPTGNWQVDFGLFHSEVDQRIAYTDVYVNVLPNGRADQQILVDPPATAFSDSGELRAARSLHEGPRLHTLIVSLKGRINNHAFGGTDTVDLGEIGVNQPQYAPRPAFAFTPKGRDRIEQGTAGLGYVGDWKTIGEFSASIQKTSYTKTAQPGGRTVATPYLAAAALTLDLTKSLVAYASTTRGLEDAGDAPPNARNANAPLTAIITHQHDAGLRYAIANGVSLIAGVFDIEKPYYTYNRNHAYSVLGNIELRGIETSVSGAITPRLDIVAGAVIADPEVIGAQNAGLGGQPVGQARQNGQINLDWRPPFADNLTLDGAVTYFGKVAATDDDRVHIPNQTFIEVGARYALKLFHAPAQLRLDVQNLTNLGGVEEASADTYEDTPGRQITLSLGADI